MTRLALLALCACATPRYTPPRVATISAVVPAVAAGTTATGTLTLRPTRPDATMLVGYPYRVTLAADPGLVLARATLARTDARFVGVDAAFPIEVTATRPGTFRVTGTVSYAVGDRYRCEMRTEPFAIAVTAR